MYTIDQQDLQYFSSKCDALIAAKLIISDKKISDILKSIASSRAFCKFIEICIKDFDYYSEFDRAIKPSQDREGCNVIILPKDEKLVAFVFCLLCELDNKERDLTLFLQEYYGLDELFTDGFANFCNEVIKQFRDTVIDLCQEKTNYDNHDELVEYLTQSEEDNVTDNHNNEDVDNLPFIPPSVIKKISTLYEELIRNILREADLTVEKRKEYVAVAQGFMQALKENSASYIKPLFLALKNMCAEYKFLNLKVSSIDKYMKEII